MNYIIIPGIKRGNLATIKEFDAELVIEAVCDFYGISTMEVRKVCRRRKLVQARQMCMFIIRKVTSMTLLEIGLLFGKDHTTAIHGINTIKGLMDVDEKIKIEADIIMNNL